MNVKESSKPGDTDRAPPAESTPAPKGNATPERLTPREWGVRKGNIVAAKVQVPGVTDQVHPFHAAADSLYGWSADEHHNQGDKAFRLTEEDYVKGLLAAAEYPLALHRPALAPACPHDHKDFKPRKRAEGATKPKLGAGWRPFN